ncbi:MAG: 6-bladed beta-propeller [Tannerella sp.]|jgi:hypothetical protein|nr:6-bladed beta-propeller [Tannerella sp.]
MKYSINMITLLLVTLVSCSNKENRETVSGILVDLSQPREIELYDLFEKVEVIIPELKDSAYIKEINRVFFTDQMICIYDHFYLGRVLLFDNSGKFIRQIGTLGEGPDEYSDIADVRINIDSKTIWLLSAIDYKFFVYNYQGDLLEIIRLPRYNRAYKSFTFLNKDSIAFWNADNPYKLKYYSLSTNTVFREEFEEPDRDIFCSYEFQIDKALCRGMTNTIYSLKKGRMEPLYTWDFGRLNNDLSDIDYPDYNNREEIMRFAKDAYSSRIINYLMFNHGMNDQYIYTQLWRKDISYNLFYNRKTEESFFFEKTMEGATMWPIYWTADFVIGLALPSLEAVLPEALITEEIREKLNQLNEESNPILIKYTFKK